MDELKLLKQWGARSDATNATPIDVTAKVLATLRQRRYEQIASPVWPLMMAAAASVLVAVSLGIVVQQSWSDFSDPLNAIISPYLVMLQ
jgi:hypothetical protein